MTGEGIGQASLPIVVVSHPVGDPDEETVRRRGVEIARECVRVLTTPADELAPEFGTKQFPLPDALMPR